MSDFVKDLEHNVEKDADARRRKLLIRHLASQGEATVEDLFNVVENSKLGDVMRTITLAELRGVEAASASDEGEAEEEVEEEEVEAASRPRKKGAKKTSKKTSKSSNGTSNGAGRRPRLDYNAMQKEVLKYMRAAKAPVSTGDVSRDLGMTGPQARKIFENLQDEKQVKRIGKGGRATKYELR